MRIVTGKEMGDFDQKTIEEIGIPAVVLMEHAGLRTALEIAESITSETKVLIIAGKGNNGGDGFVIHRWLNRWGYRCTTLLLAAEQEIKGAAGINLAILRQLQAEIVQIDNQISLEEFWCQIEQDMLIVDGILGTGLFGEVRGLSRRAIELINSTAQNVVAIDLPSGLDAVSGQPLGVAVKAQLTVTFGLPKIGLLLYPGQEYVGQLKVVDIGIPEQVIAQAEIQRFWLNEDLCRQLLPDRPLNGHKGTFGRVLVLAGSRGMTGAAVLTAEAALKSGAGLVTLGIPETLNQIVENKLTEVLTKPLPEINGQLAKSALQEIRELSEKADILTIGPGLGQSVDLVNILQAVVLEIEKPLVIDADGLNNLLPSLDLLKKRTALTVLTPHPGEMARLLGVSIAEVEKNRLVIVEKFARDFQVVLVLKGRPTLIAFPTGEVYFNSTGNHGMGTGGTGDVLTGIIGGLLAQKKDALSVAAAVYLHGLAGDLMGLKLNPRSLLARDLLNGLTLAFNRVEQRRGDDKIDGKTTASSLGGN